MNRTLTCAALSLLLSLPAAAAGGCPERSTLAQIEEVSARASAAFGGLDEVAFRAAVAESQLYIECLGDAFDPEQAIQVHLMMALSAFFSEADEDARRSLQAVLQRDPDFAYPAELNVVEGDFLDQLLAEARAQPAPQLRPLEGFGVGWLSVDGWTAREAPVDLPFVLQRRTAEGEVLETAYLVAGAPLPGWGAGEVAAGGSEPGVIQLAPPTPEETGSALTEADLSTTPGRDREGAGSRDRLRHVLLTGGAVTAAAAAGFSYYMADWSRDQVVSPETGYQYLEPLRAQSATFTYAWIGAGVATAGLGAVAVVTW
jgi:hypothetical protein